LSEFVGHLFNALTLGAIYALIAVGYTMVYGVIKLINFAHGEIYMFGTFLGLMAVAGLGWHLGFAIILAMAGCAALGAAIDAVAYRPIRGSSRLAALITAIGVSLSLQTVAQLIWGANPRAFPTEGLPAFLLRPVLSVAGANLLGKELLVWVAAVLMMLLLHLLVGYTRIGKAMRACAEDKVTAALMGIPVNRVIAVTFMIGSAMAAVAGVLYSLKAGGNISFRMGYYPGVIAFAAAVLGGIGNLKGAVLGGMLIGFTQALCGGYLASQYDFAFAFGLMIVVILFRPWGLLGRPESARA
jgi:branched-chain amino acid transport system permease protein